MGAGMGDPEEYYDDKERRNVINDVEAGLSELDVSAMDSQRPSRVNSAGFILEECGKQRSHVDDEYTAYPLAPSPLRFTHLNSPKPDAYFVASPGMNSSSSGDKRWRRDCCSGKGSCPLSRSYCCCSVVAALCSVIVTAGILLGFAVLITWLVLRPIHAPRFAVDNVEFRALAVRDSKLNADVAYALTADNANRRLGFKYDAIDIKTSYRGSVFGHSSVPPFSQAHKNLTSLTSAFVVENHVLTPASLAENLSSDVNGAGVAIHVRARAVVRLRVGRVTSFALKVFVDCGFLVKPPNGRARSSVINKTCKLTR